MNIRQKIRQALLEGKQKKTTHKNEYGCLMVYLNADKDKWEEMQNLIDDEDLYQPEDDPTYGRENEPHVTILYGFHGDIKDSDINKEINKIKKPELTFGDVSAFTNEKFDVLKFDVDSKDMHKLNDKFKEFPHTNNYPDYHPHCTIAYLKPKMAEKYIKKLKKFLDIELEPSHLVYSKVDGSKNEYKFD